MACGETVFGEYLAGYAIDGTRRRIQQESRRGYGRIIRRSQAIPRFRERRCCGTTSVCAPTAGCATWRFVATAGRLTQWHARLAMGDATADDLDMRDVHRHVFADVYPWAGSYRITELRRGDVVFAWQSGMRWRWPVSTRPRGASQQTGRSSTPPRLAFEMSRLYAEYNRVHPFREGNGRTGTLMLHTSPCCADDAWTCPHHPRRVVSGLAGQHAVSPRRPRQSPAVPTAVSSGRCANSSSPCGIGLHTPPGSV